MTGLVIYPRIDSVRSTSAFIADVQARTAGVAELGWVAAKEQYLLQMKRPSFNFGHARWRESEREIADAARWLDGSPRRGLLIDRRSIAPCFRRNHQVDIGRANGIEWVLVTGRPNPLCVDRGDATAVIAYAPP